MEEKSTRDTKMIAQEHRQRIFEDIEASGIASVREFAEQTLCAFQVDKAFIGVGGITIEHGLTEFNFDEADTRRTMIERARQCIVVADHTKFGKVMLTTVASLTVVDKIITHTEIDSEMITRPRQMGVEVTLA